MTTVRYALACAVGLLYLAAFPPSTAADTPAAESEENCRSCGSEDDGVVGWTLPPMALVPGVPAPAFSLPPLEGGTAVPSHQLFAAHALSVLILWDSHCPLCLRQVVRSALFAALADSLDCGMVYVNRDQQHLGQVRTFVRGEGLPGVVLWDRDGAAAIRYGSAGDDLSLFLIGRDAQVQYVHYGRPEDILALLRAQVRLVLQGENPPIDNGPAEGLQPDVGGEMPAISAP